MRMIICGPALSEEAELIIPGASPAAAKYLRNMANAFRKKGFDVIIFSYITADISEKAKMIIENSVDGNHYIIKGHSLCKSMLNFKKDFLSFLKNDDIVLFYNIGYAAWGLADAVKRRGIKNALILADHTGADECKNIVRKVMAKKTESEFKKFDKAILLSNKAQSLLSGECKILLAEGGVDLQVYKDFCIPHSSHRKKILYSGMLSYVTGVDLLLEAFSHIDSQNIDLCITGKGELSNNVKSAMKADSRIEFKGFVSNDEYYHILNDSDIVVNPRNMSFGQNRNNFPSKVLEYLASGRIVVSTKFSGYKRFLNNFLFCDSNVEALAEALKEAIKIKEIDRQIIFANNRIKAKDYDWNSQVGRILEFIED